MQTQILPELLATPAGQRVDAILRKCVHCGFCTATCPTYQLLGDELDGPRGRIYQIKEVFEGLPADRSVQRHLDRCLTCRSCETTCPSGVDYGELIDIGREQVESSVPRPFGERLLRRLLGSLLPYPSRHGWLFRSASTLRGLLPTGLRQKAPRIRPLGNFPNPSSDGSAGRVLLLEGCVQSTLSPNTNTAAAAVLQALGYEVLREPSPGCCGAVNQHLSQTEQARRWVRGNLERWQALDRQQGIDFIVSSASGCGVMLKDYPRILQQMPAVPEEQQSLVERIRDLSELLDAETLRRRQPDFRAPELRIAWHAPCTLTHGQRLADRLRAQLEALGFRLSVPRDAHLCCGSAGTYSLLQPELSKQLRDDKLDALNAEAPNLIITANVGCEHHLGSASELPVRHWIELVAEGLPR